MITRFIKRARPSSFYRLPRLAVCITLIALAGSAVAQVQPNYGRTYSKKQVEKLIKDVDKSGDEFRRDFDSWLDHSPLDGQQREDRYNRQVKDLTTALSTLRSNFSRDSDWWQSRKDMQSVLNQAGQVSTIVGGVEVRGKLNRRWGNLRTNLNRLAEAFNLPTVGSTYYGNQNSYPSESGAVQNWAVGTFRGVNNTGPVEMTITSQGVATIRSLNSNQVYAGRAANSVVYFEWGSFNLVQDRRGVTLVEMANEYNRTPFTRVGSQDNYPGYPNNNPGYPGTYNQNYPGNNNSGYPGQATTQPPNWAIGTFVGRDISGEPELTITASGQTSIRSASSNEVRNGQYVNGVVTFDWGSFNVRRSGRDITLTEVNNPSARSLYTRVR